MSWCWFARLPEPVDGALACAAVTDAKGHAAGALAAWPAGRKPVADAVRMDARLVDPAGDPAWISMVSLDRSIGSIGNHPCISRSGAMPEGTPSGGMHADRQSSGSFLGNDLPIANRA